MDGRTLRWENHRNELFAAITDYILDNGVATLTLRPLAEAIGSSIASLNRQFGSKEQLVEAVCIELHTRMLDDVERARSVPGASPIGVLRSLWRDWLEPAKSREFAFLFELYGLAIRDPERYQWFATSIVNDWLAPFEDALTDAGLSPDEARSATTLGLALIRGLHLDLAATHDISRVDKTFELALHLFEPHLPHE